MTRDLRGFRAEPEHVAVGVFHFHLACPRIVLGRMKNRGAAPSVLLVERVDILDAEPDPRSRLPLVTFGQVDAGAVPVDQREVVAAPLGIAEAEYVDVVRETPRQVFDPQDRMGVLECRPAGCHVSARVCVRPPSFWRQLLSWRSSWVR